MAIKFRRIEDRAESMIQQREHEAVKRERGRLLPKLIILAVVAGAAVVVYGYFHPPRIVAPFVVHVDAAQVTAPVEGSLVWLLPPAMTRVAQGDVLARIRMRPQAAGSAGARATDLRLRAEEAGTRASIEAAAQGALEADLADKARSLDAEVSRLDGEVERARGTAREAERLLEAHKREAQSAEELSHLDAVTLHDLTTAREAVHIAQAAVDEAAGYVKALETERAAAVASREQFQTTRRLSLAAAESRVQAAVSTKEALARETDVGDESLSEDGEEYIVRAPFSGQVLSIDASQESRVEQGALLVQLYDDARVVARAYVPMRYQPQLRREAAARLYFEGLKEPLVGEIVHIQERVIPLPGNLADRFGHREASVVAADIRCTQAGTRLLVPGQIGKAIIEK